MPNYQPGTDAGNFLTHTVSGDSFQNSIGPFGLTYNGLKRINTGLVIGDNLGDILPIAFQKILDNIDITVTKNDMSVANTPLKAVVRAADGSIEVGDLKATSLTLTQGIAGNVYGGTW